MQIIDNSSRVVVADEHMELLGRIDDKLKRYGVEFCITVDGAGTKFLDVQKKKITRTRRRKSDLLG